MQAARRVFAIEAAEIQALSDRLTEDFPQAVRAILSCRGRVVVCGMGKSGHIGRKIAATLSSTGTPSFFMHPAEAFHGDLGMITPEDMFVAISNSGETEEIIRLIPAVRRTGNQLVAICGRPNSTLVRNADFFLDISVSREACPLELAPTSSTTATLAMGDALAIALMEERNFKPENFAMLHPGGSLGRRLLTKVKDAMRIRNLPVVSEQASIHQLILTMTDGRVGLAIVVNEQHELVGIVSDGDLRRAWQKYGELQGIPIVEYMTRTPKVISPDVMLSEAEAMLIQHKIAVLVVTEGRRPVGLLQLYDLG